VGPGRTPPPPIPRQGGMSQWVPFADGSPPTFCWSGEGGGSLQKPLGHDSNCLSLRGRSPPSLPLISSVKSTDSFAATVYFDGTHTHVQNFRTILFRIAKFCHLFVGGQILKPKKKFRKILLWDNILNVSELTVYSLHHNNYYVNELKLYNYSEKFSPIIIYNIYLDCNYTLQFMIVNI